MMTAIFTIARMNPPTRGHEKVIETMARLGVPRIFLTKSHDPERNPLRPRDKLVFARRAFPRASIELVGNVFEAARRLAAQDFEAGVLVVGADRAEDFRRTLSPYVGTPTLGLRAIDVVMVDRTEDDISATKVRAAVRAGDRATFDALTLGSTATKSLLYARLRKRR